MRKFSHIERKKNINQFQNQKFDLLIVGGGITGAGVARDAAMRGLKVALVEARDFSEGTSSRSSKLVHGGIRYLENMEFGLVFEALSERTKLFEMAPNLVHPLRFMIPLYKSSRVGMFLMGLGMWLYDALSLFQAPEMHERLNAKDTVKRMSAIQSTDLLGSFVYSDAYMDDDRLVHETLRSANEYGALCANFVKVTSAKLDAVDGHQVQCFDEIDKRAFTLEAKHIVSCTGPWTDIFAGQLFKQWPAILRPTKGIHLTLPKGRLPLESAVVMAAEKGNRIVFGIPRHEMIIIGTTDTDFSGDPRDVRVTSEDVDYLLEIVDKYFPLAKIKREDILSCYAGVRPLVQDGSASEGKTSREHTIMQDPSGVTFVAGGKYTTYRHMAQQIVEKALNVFTIEQRARLAKVNTAEALNPMVTTENFDRALSSVEGWSRKFKRKIDEVQLLAERHGMEALEILKASKPDETYWQIEARHAIQNTMCLSVTDFMARRVPAFLSLKDHGVSIIHEVAIVFAKSFGWSDSEMQKQIQDYYSYIKQEINF